ncbi:MAG: lipoprotein signal peptidase [Neisseria zoodegmatis]|uniref:lipoprotein signal peptidase n=1 Tax=Neisseria zoodegmatis TaxID=326523 RepID=UPI0026E9B787|nr:lipoprotein signal peptidase [Neisseria zoodegmatis]MDO5070765.1 lipoprotein signal peptidase [Neisseria zoodegmatis]
MAETFAPPHLRRISALRVYALGVLPARLPIVCMSALAVLLRLELHPHLRVWQRSKAV